MTSQAKIKAVHKKMRDAGYQRRDSRMVIGNMVYDSWYHQYSNSMTVFISGNWSLKMRDRLTKELLNLFPGAKEENGVTGIRIEL